MKKFIVLLALIPVFIILISPSALTDRDSFQNEKTKEAVEKALDYIAKEQNKKGCWTLPGRESIHEPAIAAIVLMAFMSNGHVPDKGKYGSNVKNAVRYLLEDCIGNEGFIGKSMYHHGFAVLALSEMFGMTKRKDIKNKLKLAVSLIINTQNEAGSWKYSPKVAPTGDISVTSCQVQALRAARDAGFSVPASVMNKSAKFMKSCLNPSDGGFTYVPGNREPGIARTGAGVLSLMACGEYNCEEAKKGINYLLKNPTYDTYYPWYGYYYCTLTMYQAGGEPWKEWFLKNRDEMLKYQNADGSFSLIKGRESRLSAVYPTALAVISLSVSQGNLPIFQR